MTVTRKYGAEGRRLGRYIGGSVPFGYRAGRDGRLEVVPEQARRVRMIFKRARAGASLGRIAGELNEAGISSPRGKAWSRQTIAFLLANRAYMGELHGIQNAHKPIISAEVWKGAQSQWHR
jgi:DNA invertase Pin-like site-specific DNA recombinase